MKLIDRTNVEPGDIGVVEGSGIESELIIDFEREIHERFAGQFVPSHAFIVGYDGMVIEATASGLGTTNPLTEYDANAARFYRLDRTATQIQLALYDYIGQHGSQGYGWLDLLGFAIEAMKRHLGNPKARNPVLQGYVCSQAALLFLRYPSAERWPLTVELRDCDPLALMMVCEAHCA